jgi:hypothetical protein
VKRTFGPGSFFFFAGARSLLFFATVLVVAGGGIDPRSEVGLVDGCWAAGETNVVDDEAEIVGDV